MVLAAIGLVLATGGDGSRPAAGPRTHAPRTSPPSASSSTGKVTARRRRTGALRGPFRVARVTLMLVEPASASAAGGGPRQLPTIVRYPRVPASLRAGPFPLIVFSQGFDEPTRSYARLLDAWAAAGFVVAAPTYPRTDPEAPGGPDESDIVNHPADLRYVIGALTRAATSPSSRLRGRIDSREVAVVGQSDGGDVSLAVADNNCCRDAAVRAAVILSGAELSSFGGRYFTTGRMPLLVVQGTADTINAPACSALIYDQAPRPKYYLDLVGAGHLPPYVDSGPDRRAVARVVAAFLAEFLEHRRSALRGPEVRSALSAAIQLSHGSEAPVPEGACPGAP